MALKTINDLTALTTPASTDLVGVWAVGAARMRKSTIAQTFSPMLAVANVFSAKQTMDALVALKKNVAPGTTSGYLELGTDSNGDLKVQNDAGAARTLAGSISGGGTVASGGFTLTVPATGTATLVSTGIWTPTVAFSGGAGSPAATIVGTDCYYQLFRGATGVGFCALFGSLSFTNLLNASGTITIGGLPVPAIGTQSLSANYQYANIGNGASLAVYASAIYPNKSVAAANAGVLLAVADCAAGLQINLNGVYRYNPT
ncbi:MAG: hypothetical protein KAX65_01755 [Caldilineaceae bacterium]|nr:hypothetical protein [Caldilineaceae bacterium]